MSWGERSCIYLHEPDRPCKPTMQGCTVSCPMYTYDGKTPPDSVPNHGIENMLDLLAKDSPPIPKVKLDRMLKKVNRKRGMK